MTGFRIFNTLALVLPNRFPLPVRESHARSLAALVSDVNQLTQLEVERLVGAWKTIVDAAPYGTDGQPRVTMRDISRYLATHASVATIEAFGDPFADEEPETWGSLSASDRVAKRCKFHQRILDKEFPPNSIARERGEACFKAIRELGVGDLSIAEIYDKAGIPGGAKGRSALRCARSLAALDEEVISSAFQMAGSAKRWFITYSHPDNYEPFQQLRSVKVETQRHSRAAQHLSHRMGMRHDITDDVLEKAVYALVIHESERTKYVENVIDAVANYHRPMPVSQPKRKRREHADYDVPLFELSAMPM